MKHGEVRTALRVQRAELMREVGELRIGIAARNGEKRDIGDSLDGASDTAQTNTDTSLMNGKYATVRSIDEALARIDAGTYGVCVACDEPIPAKRLKVRQFATRCVPCQDKAERRMAPQPFAR